jgi:predicted dehydrogenase
MPNTNEPAAGLLLTRTEISLGRINRRRFLYSSAMAAGALAAGAGLGSRKVNYKSPNEKLDLGGIGCAGRGAADIDGVSSENIVALCDVDANNLAAMGARFPNARRYADYRVMLEKEKSIDGVTVGIPDHHHAPASMMAMSLGRHVYCEKPLTHSVWEARQMARAARKYEVMTQMGNQGHCGEGNRQLCEMIWSGVIGQVREVHCWTDRCKGWWTQGLVRPVGSDPAPASLNWDLWIGSAPMRPYLANWPKEITAAKGGPVYHPAVWKGWWDFGCGSIGDMACHIMDGAYWSLKLGAPRSVEVVQSTGPTADMPPTRSIIRFHFPARGEMAPCTLTWYDGGLRPPRPAESEAKDLADNGALLIGDKGKILSGCYGENPRLLPESSMADYKRPPQSIPRVPDNSPHRDWIRACKSGPAPCSNFEISGPFTEMVLLGNVALRLNKTIEWDSKNLRVTNAPEAAAYVKPAFRSGWNDWRV